MENRSTGDGLFYLRNKNIGSLNIQKLTCVKRMSHIYYLRIINYICISRLRHPPFNDFLDAWNDGIKIISARILSRIPGCLKAD